MKCFYRSKQNLQEDIKEKLNKLRNSMLRWPVWKTAWTFLNKVKVELSYDPTITLLDMYPKELKSVCPRDICISMFI
jgi:hypothetical protein